MRPLKYVCGGILVLACAGALNQWAAGALDRRANPAPGRMVEAGGLRMHLNCTGQGPATVVLDSGLSDSSLAWFKVQPRVAEFARVCSYDRAGIGWSDVSPRPRTSRVIAEELHALLRAGAIAPPYVLVGHSMGGLDVRAYAGMYKDEVAGMVLVDSSHPDQFNRLPGGSSSGNAWRRGLERQRLLMPFGIPRLLGWCGTAAPEIRAAFRSFDCTIRQKDTTLAEVDAFPESARQAAATATLGALPLVVLSHDPDKWPEGVKVWPELQEELKRLSSRGTRVVAKGSGHQIALERPDVVVTAVRSVIDAIGRR